MESTGRVETDVVREVYEQACECGAIVPYRNLKLEKLEWGAKPRTNWEIRRGGEYIETIDTAVYRSVSDLQQTLDAIADGADLEHTTLCKGCPLGSTPSD